VVALWRYPVKSMQGEAITSTAVSARGFIGDRAYALIEAETGYVVSAKHARKWAKVLQCRAAYIAPPQVNAPLPAIQITLPDGHEVCSHDPDVNAQLSAAIGREVILSQDVPEKATREANRAEPDDLVTNEQIRQEPIAFAAPPKTFFDFAPLHILTTATLARLRELSTEDFDVRRFRPNVVIEPTEAVVDFVENAWLGGILQFAQGAALRLMDPTPRCVITTLAQADLPQSIGILKTVVKNNALASITQYPGHVFQGVAGLYAVTQSDGQIAHGDSITLHR
jgi:uncharacterized protein YcbX